MPWKECHIVESVFGFGPLWMASRWLGSARNSAFLADGDKIYDRYKDHGALGLTERSRRPSARQSIALPIEAQIVR